MEQVRVSDDLLITAQLATRPAKKLDYDVLNRALVRLTLDMAEHPLEILQRTVEAAARLTLAQSCGISILEDSSEGKRFRWHAVTGQWGKYLGGGMPRNPSPCGTVLDQNATLLMAKPHLHYEPMRVADPGAEEVILTPFYDGSPDAVGTLWVVLHDGGRKFDSTDVYIVKELAQFTASAYKELRVLGYFD